MSKLRIARFLPHSRANGPGVRAVVWVQGCTLACPGCFNVEMQPASGGEWRTVGTLFERILALQDEIEGISVSGGEPLQQIAPLLALLQRVRRESSLSILLFTGYTWDEVQAMPGTAALLECVDMLIAGRYDAARPWGRGMLGSANQTVHLLTARYTPADVDAVPPAEAIITEEGDVILSGVAPFKKGVSVKQSGVRKWFFLVAGLVLTGLAALGLFLPLLPTTPLLVLAAACFIRSSDRLYQWLITRPAFGPYIRNYREYRAITREAKIVALAVMWLTMGYTAIFVIDSLVMRLIMLVVAVAVTVHVVKLKTISQEMLSGNSAPPAEAKDG